jgi:hypothetical protein
MSFLRTHTTRGFSVGAAFLVAVIFGGAALGIEMITPLTQTPTNLTVQTELTQEYIPASQLAAAASVPSADQASPQADSSQKSSNSPAAKTGEQKQDTRAGYDAIVFLYANNGQKSSRTGRFPVCPTDRDALLDLNASRNLQTNAQHITIALNQQDQSNARDGFGNPTYVYKGKPRCKLGETRTGTQYYAPEFSDADWPQWTIECSLTSEIVAGVTTGSRQSPIEPGNPSTYQELMWDVNHPEDFQCVVHAPDDKTSAPPPKQAVDMRSLAEKIKNADNPTEAAQIWTDANLNEADNAALKNVLREDGNKLSESLPNLQKKEADLGKQIEHLESLDNVDQDAIAELKKQREATAAEIEQNKRQLANLGRAAKSLDPNEDQTGLRNDNDPFGHGGVYSKDMGYGLGTRFGDTGGNAVESPFGGRCVRGYVCEGNTLYYQYQGEDATHYYCNAQPVQQCQYGCQQANGSGGQISTGGQESMLGGFIKGLQIASTLINMFGGGNGGSQGAAPMSHSCAPPHQNQNGTGSNGQACPSRPPEPNPAQCTSGSWKPTSQNGCLVGWQCVPDGNGKPSAQLSCAPHMADVGTPISFSFSCGSASASVGTGFDTHGMLSGNATTTAPETPPGRSVATFALTCIKLGITTSAQCDVQIGKPGIVLVTNPGEVRGGDMALIGWVTSGMQSCTLSSPDQADFTSRNAARTDTSGAATTSPLLMDSRFQIDCISISGEYRQATTTVRMI